jgi:bleomycin hydrolase
MVRHSFLVLLMTIAASLAHAQTLKKSSAVLDDEALTNLRQSFKIDSNAQTVMNALAKNSIKELVINEEAKKGIVNLFSNKVEAKGITNQNKSGRCWLFATLNTLRPVMIKKFKLSNFEFSYNYLFFWDKLEKSNIFLEKMIELIDRPLRQDRELEWWLRSPAGDGGQWNMAVDLIEKYGLVPLYAMPENVQSEESRRMNAVLFRKLRQAAFVFRSLRSKGATVIDLRKKKIEILKDVYRILSLNLGVPPTTIEWRYENKDGRVSKTKNLTPQEFYKKVVKVDLKKYVYLMHSPNHPLNEVYRINANRSLVDSAGMLFVNLPIERLKEFAVKAIKKGEALWFSADVGKDHDPGGWLAPEIYALEELYNVDLKLDKSARLLYRESLPNHAMAFIGVDLKKSKPVKWLVENSWGEERGSKGFWTMTDKWFDEYVYGLIIHRKYLPSDVLKIYEAKPHELPFHDPVWNR